MKEKAPKRKRGAQPGNQNACKHGFYSKHLEKARRQEIKEAARNGLDEEIALLRLKIRDILEHDPHNLNLVIRAMGTLARMLRLKYKLGTHEEQKLADALNCVVKEVFQPLGLEL